MGTRQVIFLLSIASYHFHATAEENTAARFELSNIDNLIMQREETLALNGRTLDPFGKPLDPNKKVEVKIDNRPNKPAPKKVERILIEREIARLAKMGNVLGSTMIIEGQPYRRGDSIKVSVKGKIFPLKIRAITRSRIIFYDPKEKNTFSLDMNNLPDTAIGSDPNEVDLRGEGKTHKLK